MSQEQPAARSRLEQAVAAGGDSTRRALERLFAPARVVSGEVRPLGALGLERAVAVRFCIEGQAGTRLLLVADERGGALLGSALLARKETRLDARAREALAELANIAASSFLTGVSRAASLRLLPSVPVLETFEAEAAHEVLAGLGPHAYEAPFEVELPNGRARALFIAAADDDSMTALKGLLDGR